MSPPRRSRRWSWFWRVRLWPADIKEIPTFEGKLYLASVLDCFSRKVVGWSMRDDMKTELVVA